MKRLRAIGSLIAISSAVLGSPASAQNALDYFVLQTAFQAPENKCFEGNKFARDYVLQGAAHMANCDDVSGQYWKAVPVGGGYFRLKTLFQGEHKCLEGNRYAPDAVLGGGAYMDDCQNVTGQFWKAVPAGQGYFRLKTKFQGEHRCLEGNRVADNYPLRGAAYMDKCQNVTGQLWKIVGGKLVKGIPRAH